MLFLNRFRIEGRRRAAQLLFEGQRAPEILESMASKEFLKELPVTENAGPFNAEKEIELCALKESSFLLLSDPEYPRGLREIADPPLRLYKKGRILGMTGTR